ncbi:MAG: hypothetical protein Q7R83_03255 [bacterium]|nr:hypothetical protein [bacterium]
MCDQEDYEDALDRWATSLVVQDLAYWEDRFPGYGRKILGVVGKFRGWKPTFAPADPKLQDVLPAAFRCIGSPLVKVTNVECAQDAQDAITCGIVEFFETYKDASFANAHPHVREEVNDAIGDAFGSIMGPPVPPVMLRSWLYGLFVAYIIFLLSNNEEMASAVESVIGFWYAGNYLIGIQNEYHGNRPVCHVVAG